MHCFPQRRRPWGLFVAPWFCLIFLFYGCAAQQAPYAVRTGGLDAGAAAAGDQADHECSYFYFLWGRSAELNNEIDEALEAYQKALVCDDDAPRVVRRLAVLLLRMDRGDEALGYVRAQVDRHPNDTGMRLFEAGLYAAMEESDQAMAIYNDLLQAAPNDTDVLLQRGKLHYANHDYDPAAADFETLTATDPESFVGWYYLARLYRRQQRNRLAASAYRKALALEWSPELAMEGADFFRSRKQYAQAVSLYREILDKDDDNETAGARLVGTYLEMDQPQQALAVLEELRASGLDDDKIDFTIGKILLEQKDYDHAIELFTAMLQRASTRSVAKSLLALAYYEKGDHERAVATLRDVKPGERGYDESRFMLARILAEDGDLAAAIEVMRAAIDADLNGNVDFYTVLASLYEEAGRNDDAEDTYEAAIHRFADDTGILFKYAMFLERHGRHDEGMERAAEVLDIDPDDPYALNFLGYSWADAGIHLQRALRYIRRAVSIKPGDPFIRDSLGWVYYRLGRYDEAVAELKKAVADEPEDPTMNEHLGDARKAAGRRDLALESYRKALDLLGDGDEKEAAAKRLRAKIKALRRQ